MPPRRISVSSALSSKREAVTAPQQYSGEADVQRLRTLYHLLSALSRATRLQQIYDAAIEALLSATAADRAAILLFDDDGVMRFAAWRGVSAAYRHAVTGHSPWKRGERDARPITVSDVSADASLAAFRK